MIVVTRFNGPPLAINCDLIERAEETPDTVLTLVDGTKFVVRESLAEIIDRIREFRASVVVAAQRLEEQGEIEAEPNLRIIQADNEFDNKFQSGPFDDIAGNGEG